VVFVFPVRDHDECEPDTAVVATPHGVGHVPVCSRPCATTRVLSFGPVPTSYYVGGDVDPGGPAMCVDGKTIVPTVRLLLVLATGTSFSCCWVKLARGLLPTMGVSINHLRAEETKDWKGLIKHFPLQRFINSAGNSAFFRTVFSPVFPNIDIQCPDGPVLV
jgi:hypothetical protein